MALLLIFSGTVDILYIWYVANIHTVLYILVQHTWYIHIKHEAYCAQRRAGATRRATRDAATPRQTHRLEGNSRKESGGGRRGKPSFGSKEAFFVYGSVYCPNSPSKRVPTEKILLSLLRERKKKVIT
jgi:hypothetical protein